MFPSQEVRDLISLGSCCNADDHYFAMSPSQDVRDLMS